MSELRADDIKTEAKAQRTDTQSETAQLWVTSVGKDGPALTRLQWIEAWMTACRCSRQAAATAFDALRSSGVIIRASVKND